MFLTPLCRYTVRCQGYTNARAVILWPAHVHELRGVIERENAQVGVLITLQEPTKPMTVDAASAGFYHSPGWNKDYPRLQILTVADLLAGKGIDMPPLGQVSVTFKKAPKAKATAETVPLPFGQ